MAPRKFTFVLARSNSPIIAAIVAVLLTSCTGPDRQSAPTIAAEFNLSSSSDLEQEFALMQAREVEERIQTCMAKRGFEYKSAPITAEEVVGHEIGAGLDEAEWAHQYGFGAAPVMVESIANSIEELEELDELERSGVFQDPNQEYLDTLSEKEREQWSRALTGTMEEMFGESEPETEPCVNVAERELEESSSLVIKAQEDLHSIYLEKVPQDDRMIQAKKEWVECASSKGYNVASRDDLIADFDKEAREASGSFHSTSTPPPALIEQATREITAAVEILPCDVRFKETWESVRKEYENEFLAQPPG